MAADAPRSLLVVGDGDLSFTASLIRSGRVSAATTTVAIIESAAEFGRKYGQSGLDNAVYLVSRNVVVHYGVDATDFAGTGASLRAGGSGPRFSVVRWNFPHPLKYSPNLPGEDARRLLTGFLKSVETVLPSGDEGEVVISLLAKQWTRWNMTKVLEETGFRLAQSPRPFSLEEYPGYRPCHGDTRQRHQKNGHGALFVANGNPFTFVLDRKLSGDRFAFDPNANMGATSTRMKMKKGKSKRKMKKKNQGVVKTGSKSSSTGENSASTAAPSGAGAGSSSSFFPMPSAGGGAASRSSFFASSFAREAPLPPTIAEPAPFGFPYLGAAASSSAVVPPSMPTSGAVRKTGMKKMGMKRKKKNQGKSSSSSTGENSASATSTATPSAGAASMPSIGAASTSSLFPSVPFGAPLRFPPTIAGPAAPFGLPYNLGAAASSSAVTLVVMPTSGVVRKTGMKKMGMKRKKKKAATANSF